MTRTIEQVVGANISRHRKMRRWSQSQLGEAIAPHLGVALPRQAIYAAESGRRSLPIAEVVTFALALDVTVLDLLTPEHDAVTVTERTTLTPTQARDLLAPTQDAQAARAALDTLREALQDALASLDRGNH